MTIDTTTKKPRAQTWDAAVAASAEAEADRAHPPRTFAEILPVRLTEQEIAERARRASVARRRIAEFESQKDAANSHWKTKIASAEQERDELLDMIEAGAEERAVECVETFEWRTGIVVVTRADTGERVRERAMTMAERQPDLPAIGSNGGAKHAAESSPIAHDGDEPEDDDVGAAFLHDTDDLDALERDLDAVTPADPYEITGAMPDEPEAPPQPKRARRSKGKS